MAPLSTAPMERRDGRSRQILPATGTTNGLPALPPPWRRSLSQSEPPRPGRTAGAPVATRWNTQLGAGSGNRVVWMARNDQSAQINLNPPQMGPRSPSTSMATRRRPFVLPMPKFGRPSRMPAAVAGNAARLGHQSQPGRRRHQAQQHSQGEAGQGAGIPFGGR